MKNILLAFSRKRQIEYEKTLGEKSGLHITDLPNTNKQGAFLMVLCKAFVVFFILMGSADCYMSGFGVSYDVTKTALMAAAVALVFCLANTRLSATVVVYSSACYQVSYLCRERFDEVFSGVVAIVNQSYSLIMEKYKFPSVDGFAEIIPDRSITVALVLYLGLLVAGMLVAFFVCRFMNLMFVMLITSLPIGMVLFFDGKPSAVSFGMLVMAWVIVAIVKFGGKFGHTKKKRRLGAWYFKDRVFYRQICDGATMLQAVVFSALMVAACGGLVATLFGSSLFNNLVPESKTKQSIDNIVRDNMIVAFSNYKNYKINGYQPMGQLGFYGESEPDFETDLVITLVPYTTNRIYFKSYTGSVYKYKNNMWGNLSEKECFNDVNEASAPAKYGAEEGTVKIKIENKGVAGPVAFVPYYTDYAENSELYYVQDDITNGTSSVGSVNEFKYHPFNEKTSYKPSADYESFVYSHYLQVPKQLELKLSALTSGQGFHKDDRDLDQKICDYFQNNYEYSFKSGRLPWQTDFIEYFLFENKKGVCAHFASSAVMIYRSLGIPARYVEGYCGDYLQIMDGKHLESENPEDYLQGIKPLSSTVMEAELSDYNAHAWVEIYKKGKGWVVVDPTPYVDQLDLEEENKKTNFFDSLFEFLGRNKTNKNSYDNFKKIAEKVIKTIVSIVMLVLLSLVFFVLLRPVFMNLVRAIAKKKSDTKKVVTMEYAYLEHMGVYGNIIADGQCLRDFVKVLTEKGMEQGEAEKLYHYTEKALFSQNCITKEELQELIALYKTAKKIVLNTLPFTKKIVVVFKCVR